MVEYVVAFAWERHNFRVGVECGDVMGMSVGFLEIRSFHGRYGGDGMGLIEDGLIALQSFCFEEEKFLFDSDQCLANAYKAMN